MQHFGQRHRSGLVASAVAALSGFALTAVAVAPLMTDSSTVTQQVITERVAPENMGSQLDDLATHAFTLHRNDVTRSTDTSERLLTRLGVRDPEAVSFIRSDATARQLLTGRGGKMVQVQTDADGRLQSLVARYPGEKGEQAKTHFTRLTVGRIGGRWVSRAVAVAYGSQMRLASGTIRNTLFGATDEAGLPDAVAEQMAEIFSTDIDFHRELRKGDSFSVVYEALTADGEPVAWSDTGGRVAAAEFINNRKAYHAVWFEGGDGRGAYYGLDGRSKRNAFLASPLEFSRVTSGFSMRLNPLLQTWHWHKGVDYGAPIGTPVLSVGDGTVEFAGKQNGYGNVIEVRHAGDRSTLYAHLSRIDVKKGQKVMQGQNLGAVGSTGWSTGPHLHFEFRVAGVHQDPLLVAKSFESTTLDASARRRFSELASALQTRLVVAQSLAGSRRRIE